MCTRLLIVDDDDDDKQILNHALGAANVQNDVVFIPDGVELLNYLKELENNGETNLSLLVMLDLNMPKLSGTDVMKEMKAHPVWKSIPVIIFSTSDYAKDVDECYALGAASYIVKPLSYARLVAIFSVVKSYWLETVVLPGK